MKYKLRIKGSAQKQLNKLPKKYRSRILSGLIELTRDPFIGKKLEGDYQGYFSIRVWPYRIIYHVVKNELLVVVVRIGHRQGVYK